MIAHVRGVLVEKSYERVVVDVGGVGYALLVSLQTLAELPETGREVTLRSHLIVREDAHLLYGFAGDGERRAFELLLSASGVGPKLAMSILSSLRPEQLAAAIRAGDVTRLSKTPGVGKKTAEKIVVELRDRLDRLGALPSAAGGAASVPAPATSARGLAGVAGQVASALVNLGYRPDDAARAAEEAVAAGEQQPLERLLRDALRALSG